MNEKAKKNISEFKRRQKRQFVVAVLVVPIIVVAFAIRDVVDNRILEAWWAVGGCIVVSGLVIFDLINWRCPNCNQYLGKTWMPKSCRKCDAPFEE